MVTGVWSKQIAAANERSGQSINANGMLGASVVLVAVTGLGLRLKLRLIREVVRDFVEVLNGGTGSFFNVTGSTYRAPWYSHKRKPWMGKPQYEQPRSSAGGGSSRQQHEAWREHVRRQQQQQQQGQRQQGQRQQQQQQRVDPDGALASHRALLGVRAGCSRAELKKAYYQKAKEQHPDASGQRGGDAEDFKRLKAAYDTLRVDAPP